MHRALLLAVAALLGSHLTAAEARAPTVWLLEKTEQVGDHATEVLGAPQITADPDGKSVHFDGKSDGLFVSANPLAGRREFTVEVLFRPEEGGGEAQRFLHLQDTATWRVMIETRLNGQGGWWLDTFLGNATHGQPLIDPTRVHATGQWYWVALRYDGQRMAHFVNGEQEREAAVEFGPMVDGRMSLGVRQNKVYWFKGSIREVRFHPVALAPGALQRVPPKP